MKRRQSTAIIAALILLTQVSCAGEPIEQQESTETEFQESEIQTEQIYTLELPEVDYQGEDFTIFMRNSQYFIGDQFADELNGEILNDSLYNRNLTVQNLFNINFKLAISSDSTYGTDAKNSILSGDDTYDLIAVHARAAFGYGYDHLALDWNKDLPYVNLDMPWYNADAQKLAVNGKLYQMTGDISYQSFGRIVGMIFNKDIFDDLNIDYPYQSALDGEWTMDEFIRLSKLAVMDLDGDGQITFEKDRLGYITDWNYGPNQALFSSGEHMAIVNDDGWMELSVNTPRTIEVFEKFFAFTDSESAHIQIRGDVNNVITLFKNKYTLFVDILLDNIRNLRDMESEFGILPWPKYDEQCEKYYSLMGAGSNMFVVPISVKDPERASIIIEALSYYGWRDVLPNYKLSVIEGKYSRDEDSLPMLDLIYEGQTFDVAYFYDTGIFSSKLSDTGLNLAADQNHNFASFYAANESSALACIKKINAAYD